MSTRCKLTGLKCCGRPPANGQQWASVTPDRKGNARRGQFDRRTRSGKRALMAYHEAAHAVVFSAFSWRVLVVTLRRQGESLGRVSTYAYQGSAEYFESALSREPSERANSTFHMQCWIMAMLAGLVGEAICRGETFNQRRFDDCTYWVDGKPIPAEKLWPGYLQHTDRDKAHMVAERILVLQPGRSSGVAEHLRKAWASTEELLWTHGIWAAVERVAAALLLSPNLELDEDEIEVAIGEERPYLFELAQPWSYAEREAACRMDWSCGIPKETQDDHGPAPIPERHTAHTKPDA